MYLLYSDINSFENMLHKEKGRSSEYAVLGPCCAACRIRCLWVYLFVKLNQAADAAHFNSSELLIPHPGQLFSISSFMLHVPTVSLSATGLLYNRLCCFALMLHSFWLPSGSGTNAFLRHLL